RLIGARLGANLALAGAVLSNPGKVALNLDRATLGDCDATGIEGCGQVSCVGARIPSGLNLTDARLDSGGDQPAVAADGAAVDGLLVLTRLQARGELSFRTSRVGQRVLLMGARAENPGGVALRFTRAEVAADMFCDDMTVIGKMRLTGARIGGTLNLERVHLINPADVAVNAQAMQAGQVTLLPAEPIQGTVDLSHARIGVLVDNPACWPATLDLSGLTYQALEPQLPARDRLRWLARHSEGREPGPYEQLASHYIAAGQPAQARRVLYARERRQRERKPPLGRAWSWLQDLTVGYGYQPWRAAFVACVAAGGRERGVPCRSATAVPARRHTPLQRRHLHARPAAARDRSRPEACVQPGRRGAVVLLCPHRRGLAARDHHRRRRRTRTQPQLARSGSQVR